MKVSTTLNVSAEYLFSRLVDNAVYDIKQETGKSISADELEGVSYKTHVDKRTCCGSPCVRRVHQYRWVLLLLVAHNTCHTLP